MQENKRLRSLLDEHSMLHQEVMKASLFVPKRDNTVSQEPLTAMPVYHLNKLNGWKNAGFVQSSFLNM
jgi:hypothetical protein